MSQPLFVIAAGTLAGVLFCGSHAIMLWWYRRKERLRFDRMARSFRQTARPWWVTEREDQ